MPPKKRAAEEATSGEAKQSKTEDSTSSSSSSESSSTTPYTGFVFVITGNFPMSSDMIERRITTLGGRVVTAVSKTTTHIMLGDSGVTQYGQKTGVGSKKYKEAKKRKCTEVSYQQLVDAETASQSNGGGESSSSSAASKFQSEWDELLKVIQAGADKGLWEMPLFNPPATLEEIGTIEKEFGYRFGKYNDLLLLANGMSWYKYKDVTIKGVKEDVSIVFGGTGDGEDDLRHAFNYSGDFGCKHFRSRKEVPMQMIDYDFCVNVYKVDSGKLMQDDRECGKYRSLHSSIPAWLTSITKKLQLAVDDSQKESSA